MIQTKSVFAAREADDGYRVFFDAEWPAGAPRGKAAGCEWMKSLGPSENLRRWTERNPRKLPSFTDKYLAELGHNEKGVARLCALHKQYGTLTLLYGTNEAEWKIAETLAKYLRAHCDAG